MKRRGHKVRLSAAIELKTFRTANPALYHLSHHLCPIQFLLTSTRHLKKAEVSVAAKQGRKINQYTK